MPRRCKDFGMIGHYHGNIGEAVLHYELSAWRPDRIDSRFRFY